MNDANGMRFVGCMCSSSCCCCCWCCSFVRYEMAQIRIVERSPVEHTPHATHHSRAAQNSTRVAKHSASRVQAANSFAAVCPYIVNTYKLAPWLQHGLRRYVGVGCAVLMRCSRVNPKCPLIMRAYASRTTSATRRTNGSNSSKNCYSTSTQPPAANVVAPCNSQRVASKAHTSLTLSAYSCCCCCLLPSSK